MPLDGKGTVMRSIWMRLSLALALLGVMPLASAAGFDCAKAKSAVEQEICADPELSQLDTQMTQAFERARAKAGPQMDALLRDQRNWLGERDDAVIGQNAVPLYQGRITFLQHVFDAPPTDAPLLAAIVKHIASQPPVALLQRDAEMGEVMGGDGSVFRLATEQRFDPTKPLPFDTGPLLELADQLRVEGAFNVTLLRLDSVHLAALYGIEGDADCESRYLLNWSGGVARFASMSGLLNSNCWKFGEFGWLIEFRDHAYALQSHESGVAVSDIEAQRWDGSDWGLRKRVYVRYDYATSPQYVYCAQSDCTGLTLLASKVLAHYLQGRDADALIGHISPDVKLQFEKEQEQATSDNGVGELPVGSGRSYSGGGQFNSFSVFFPIHWHGDWLLGRIGHDTFSDGYSNDDFLLGIWRWDGHVFVPVLGMAAPTQRTRFLLATWLPAKPIKSN